MEMVRYESMGPLAADVWGESTYYSSGPGVFVFLVTSPLDDADSLHVQIEEAPDSEGAFTIIEDVTVPPGDRSSTYAWTGFQSSPVPLVDSLWRATVRAKHDSTRALSIAVRIIKL